MHFTFKKEIGCFSCNGWLTGLQETLNELFPTDPQTGQFSFNFDATGMGSAGVW